MLRKSRIRWAALAAALLLAGGLAAEPPQPGAPREAPRARPWLGVLLGQAVDGGVRIVAVVPGGPAELAGLRAGDVLIRLGPTVVTGSDDVGHALESVDPGSPVQAHLVRNGEPLETTIRPAARRGPAPPAILEHRLELREPPGPPRPSAPGLEGLLGARLAEMPPELRHHFGAPGEAGVLVLDVERGAAAERHGVRVGDVVVRACGRAVVHPASDPCPGSVAGPEERRIALEVVRERTPIVLKVELPEGYAAPSAPGAPVAGETLAIDERTRELRVRMLELEIARLEQRLAALKRQLDALK